MRAHVKQYTRMALPLIAALAVLPAVALAPSAAAATGPSYAIAFEAVSNQHLWYYDSSTGNHDTGFAMAYGSSGTVQTSPAIVFDNSGSYVIAFQANTAHGAGAGHLYIYTPTGNDHLDTGLIMNPGTSPSISQTDVVAFQANTGYLWYYTIEGQAHNTGLAMAPGTSPSISPDGAEIVFQANTGYLWTYTVGGSAHNTGLAMTSGTSPSLGMCSLSCYTVAFDANTGILWTYVVGGSADDTGLRMFDSPAMDPTNAEYVAFASLPSGQVLWLNTLSGAVGSDVGADAASQIQNGSSPSMGPQVDPVTGEVTDHWIAFSAVGGGGDLASYDINYDLTGDYGVGVEPFTSPAYSVGARLSLE
jgi:hypothetical protein